jgi:uncharacterized protein YcfL
MKTSSAAFFAAALLALFAGCASEPRPLSSQDSTRYSVENTENFDLLDKATQAAITCTGLHPRTLADGRLEVVANVKNREAQKISVQINCVFKDEQGFSTNDETPFQTLTLAPNATEAVRFTAANLAAKKYTIRVRSAR